MKEKLVTVYRHKLLQPIETVKALLENNGIYCLVKGVDRVEPDVMYATGMELQVYDTDREDAMKLIKEAGFSNL